MSAKGATGGDDRNRRAIRCFISGKVQGVFYRASAAAEARRLGIDGWVRNLPDGRVEVVACGDTDALGELASWLWRGPSGASVGGVTVEEWTGESVAPGFSVR